MRRPRGISLIDLLVATFLGALLLALIALFWQGVGRHHRFIGQKLSLREVAESFVGQLQDDLEKTSSEAITLSEDGKNVTFQSMDGLAQPGDLHWSNRFLCYRHQGGQLSRWEHTLAEAGQPEHLTPATLAGWSPSASAQQWQDAAEFECSLPAGQPVLKLHLLFQHDRHKYEVDRVLFVWNGFEP